MAITTAQVERLCPTARADLVAAIVIGWSYAEARGIDTPLRTQMFLASIATETGGIRFIEENLNYTTVARIRAVWPTRFPTDESAQPYLREPEKLALKVYSNRLGNGPISSGDGWKFRGGGFIQVTGRGNYRSVGHEADPETLRDPTSGFKAAVDWWVATGCNAVADKNDPEAMRQKVNGGLNGFDQFMTYLGKARKIFVDIPVQPIPRPLPPFDDPGAEIPIPFPDDRPTPSHVKQSMVWGLVFVAIAIVGVVALVIFT